MSCIFILFGMVQSCQEKKYYSQQDWEIALGVLWHVIYNQNPEGNKPEKRILKY